jgi:uncharacterized protein YegJ (DUF2314 family)
MRLELLFVSAVTLLLALSPVVADDKGKTKAPDIVLVSENDKEMNAAMEKARKSVDDFINVFEKRKKRQSNFAVKVAIQDGKNVEHFWVEVTKFADQQFEGRISNDPMIVKTVAAGDEVKVAKDKIGDWMYVENKKLVGAYTTRVLRNRLSPEERKALDESIPYKID